MLALIFLDLFVLSRGARVMSLRKAAVMTAVWVGVALAVNLFIYLVLGRKSAVEYFTGWLLEYSLSIDNLFVFLLVFSYFKVTPRYQRRVLQWGILGALIMRAVFILLGTTLLNLFSPVIYVFGALLVYSGIKLLREGDEAEPDLQNNVAVRFVKRFFPVTDEYHDEHFFVVREGRRWATPLLLVLGVIETTDLIFAVDSIPAVIGITKDPFIVFSSNIMAVLGLRALYFLLSGVMDSFRYLKYALAGILVFVGLKMLTEDWLLEHTLHIPKETLVLATLVFIISGLTIAIVASILRNRFERGRSPAHKA